MRRFPTGGWRGRPGFRAAATRIAAGLLLLLAAGCRTGGEPGTVFDRADHRGVWPEPPAPPRIAYLFSVSAPSDLRFRVSGWKKITGWLTGKNAARMKLVKPFAVAVDEEDNLCVTDTGLGALWFFDFVHRRFRLWRRIGGHWLVQPVAVARRHGRFYLADSGLQRVLIFREARHLLGEIVLSPGRPAGVAVGADRLYVADSARHQIRVYDLTGRLLARWGRRGTAPGEFNFPTHLAVDAAGRLFVTDTLNARVQVFDPGGGLVAVLGRVGDTSGHFGRPKAAAADSWGHIYVTDGLFDNFQVFDLRGRFLLHVGETGTGPGQFWLPAGVAVDGKGRIFVADSYNRRVQVFEYLPRGDEAEGP